MKYDGSSVVEISEWSHSFGIRSHTNVSFFKKNWSWKITSGSSGLANLFSANRFIKVTSVGAIYLVDLNFNRVFGVKKNFETFRLPRHVLSDPRHQSVPHLLVFFFSNLVMGTFNSLFSDVAFLPLDFNWNFHAHDCTKVACGSNNNIVSLHVSIPGAYVSFKHVSMAGMLSCVCLAPSLLPTTSFLLDSFVWKREKFSLSSKILDFVGLMLILAKKRGRRKFWVCG